MAGEANDDNVVSPSDELLKQIAQAPSAPPPETLSGTRLGHYRISETLGLGGMGQVYRALDEKLGREVALKVLPPNLLDDPERKERFVREAKLAAKCTHANIAAIYEVGEDEGRIYLAMELVQGPTLRERLSKSIEPIEVARIGVEIARGLAKAHGLGIVHRDLKPENVMLAEDGAAKILDFGIAKLDATNEAAGALTRDGVLLGTPGYLSPEQARSAPVDARSDVFSLGAILYEMVTGERPFQGATIVDVLHATMHAEAKPPRKLKDQIAPELEATILRCLEKDPAQRYQTSRELEQALRPLAGISPAASRRPPKRTLGLAAGLFLGAAAVGIAVQAIGTRSDTKESDAPPRIEQITDALGIETDPSLSPDGKFVTYASNAAGSWDIYLLRLGGDRAINLTQDSKADETSPSFSPDGTQIAFESTREGAAIYVMGTPGDSVRKIADNAFMPAWSPDAKEIVYGTDAFLSALSRQKASEIWAVEVATLKRRLVYKGDAMHPTFSPNGKRIAFWSSINGQRDILTIDSQGKEAPVPVTHDVPTDYNPIWSPSGAQLYFLSDRAGAFHPWRIAIDPESGVVRGEPEPLVWGTGPIWEMAASRNGDVAVALRTTTYAMKRYRLDIERAEIVGVGEPVFESSKMLDGRIDVSPDGSLIVISRQGRPDEDIDLMSTDGRSTRTLVPGNKSRNRNPVFSPDGGRIAFFSNRDGSYQVWVVNTDGSGLRRITDGSVGFLGAIWSPDGKKIISNSLSRRTAGVFSVPDTGTAKDIEVALAVSPDPQDFDATSWSRYDELTGLIGDHDVGFRVALYAFARNSAAEAITAKIPLDRRHSNTGLEPRWLPDGRRLLFGDSTGISVLDTRTKDVRLIVPSEKGVTPLSFAVTGKGDALYVVFDHTESDLWRLHPR
jgi:serine/threonine protein kinase